MFPVSNTCISLTTAGLYQVSFDHMLPKHKLLVAVNIICLVGLLLCTALLMGLGNNRLAVEILLSGELSLSFIAAGSHAHLKFHAKREVLNTERFSMDSGKIKIVIEKTKIGEFPLLVLKKFVAKIRKQIRIEKDPKLHIRFIGQAGWDAGALSEEFLDELVQGAVDSGSFQIVENTALAMPASLHRDDLESYRQIGQVVMWSSPKYMIGLHVDPSVLDVAFEMRPSEIDLAFEELNFERKLTLFKRLLTLQNDHSFDPLFSLLESSNWDEGQLQSAIALAGSESPSVREALKQRAAAYFEPKLRGIHALASGMKSICEARGQSWEFDPMAFSLQVQGMFDREMIAESLRFRESNNEIEKKMRWIQEWIREEAEETELRQMLKFITGREGLRPGETITVTIQNACFEELLPVPRVQACGNQIALSPLPVGNPDGFNDFTKENFLACFKQSLLGEEAGFTTV